MIPPIWIGEYFCFSIGGFLIPLGLSVYLLLSCGWSRDLLRSLIGTILVAAIIYGLEWLLPADPEEMIIDNMYVYGVVAGVVAYTLGRSRRNAFISCLFGITLAQLVQWIINFSMNTPSVLGLGVGGAFSTYIVAIIISVAVSEFFGRCFESASKDKEKNAANVRLPIIRSPPLYEILLLYHINMNISCFLRNSISLHHFIYISIFADHFRYTFKIHCRTDDYKNTVYNLKCSCL